MCTLGHDTTDVAASMVQGLLDFPSRLPFSQQRRLKHLPGLGKIGHLALGDADDLKPPLPDLDIVPPEGPAGNMYMCCCVLLPEQIA